MRIMNFRNYIKENHHEEDVVDFLLKLNNNDIKNYINKLISHDNSDKKECVEDILLELHDLTSDEKYKWVKEELKKLI
jgi:hypothetical protein